jgi:hypothetical protein
MAKKIICDRNGVFYIVYENFDINLKAFMVDLEPFQPSLDRKTFIRVASLLLKEI